MLTATELRRMVKAHNKLMDMVIPPKTNRDGIIKLIEKNGFKVDHDKKKIVPSIQMKRKPTVKLPPAPPKKTEEEKKAAKDKRTKREQDRDQVGYDRVVLRKGEHKMPDGSVMKDKDMPKKELKEIKLKGGGTLKPYVKPVKKEAPKPAVKKEEVTPKKGGGIDTIVNSFVWKNKAWSTDTNRSIGVMPGDTTIARIKLKGYVIPPDLSEGLKSKKWETPTHMISLMEGQPKQKDLNNKKWKPTDMIIKIKDKGKVIKTYNLKKD